MSRWDSSRGSEPERWAEAQIPMFVCRHCGVFVYSPPIPHRFGIPGESCAEERVEITQVVDAFAAARIERLTDVLREIAAVKDMQFAFMAATMRQLARKALFEMEEQEVRPRRTELFGGWPNQTLDVE